MLGPDLLSLSRCLPWRPLPSSFYHKEAMWTDRSPALSYESHMAISLLLKNAPLVTECFQDMIYYLVTCPVLWWMRWRGAHGNLKIPGEERTCFPIQGNDAFLSVGITHISPDQEAGICRVLWGTGIFLLSFSFQGEDSLSLRESRIFQFTVPCSCLWLEESKLISHVENTKTDRCI